jgi:hypothetical protein
MSDNVAVAWNRIALQAVRQTRMGPPLVARALHILHASIYDAWAAHDDLAFGSRLGDELRRPPAGRTQPAKREAASFAAHLALADLFPSQRAAFAGLLRDLGYDPDAAGPAGSPGAVGVQAARAVLAFRHGDGSNQLGDLARSRTGWPPPTRTGPATGRPTPWPGCSTPTAGSPCRLPTGWGSASWPPSGA